MAAVDGPTHFPELNTLLAEFVAGLRVALGANLRGAYLQGSFALGDADEHSDVDFVVAVDREPGTDEEAALQRLHGVLFERQTPWAQHLEGSYAPTEVLRRVDPERRPLLFLDNGARELVRDPHCNSAVVRWILRERGVVLAGPPPAALVHPVDAADLRAEGRRALDEYVAWAQELDERRAAGDAVAFSRWAQTYIVLTLCRILHMLAHGALASKRRAAEWALDELDPRWAPLVRRALADRPDPWRRVHEPAAAVDVAATLAFADAATRAASGSARRPRTGRSAPG